MVYYLSNGNKFFLYSEYIDVIYVEFNIGAGLVKNSTRWREVDIFKSRETLAAISKFLQSDNQGDRNIGLKMLEQILKVDINGEVVGHGESL